MILTFILLIYTLFLSILTVIVLFNATKRVQSPRSPDNLPPLSIIIPFRNEAENLAPLLQSLNKQEYAGQFEILLINDNSTDNSLQIINFQLPTLNISVRILESNYNTDEPTTSKQQAIEMGIENARFDQIVLTDADMLFDSDWLQYLGTQMHLGADLSFGRTDIIKSNKIFSYFQAFQLDFLFSVAYAFSLAGLTGSCMGNNIVVSKKQYQNLGGHKKIGHSIVEDRALYSLFKENNKVCTITEPFFAKAHTYPCRTVKQFFYQMLRWAKGGFNTGSNLLPVGLLFLFQNTFFCLAFFQILPWHTQTVVFVNFLLTWFFIFLCFKTIQSKVNPLLFPAFYLLLIIESISFLTSSLFLPKIQWKGRKI